ncbi:histidine triad (HIT) family protein [Lachnotalea glycerini]|jgi:histidine triad (HIT) family protein|uniref:HIT family protein n=1 Tax=Lachnotalea glycerini TaxID=1763509 RepID=A0A255S328_9FIRM|nr:HIT family protein [Lachnotalea glycerini]OYP47398.1 HIT family protein [Lachnotalea glycerini]PXV91816.1 histidine triad (HIT) family protein [Lachnotalea glycerini]RDY31240.1 HIT family protein [Lachnotalea glycerini]
MKDNNCIFCKISNGDIPSKAIYEDQSFKVILDIGPASKGHALILPKAHYANIYELDEETTKRAFLLAKRMAEKMTKALECDGFNIVQNNGTAAGQTVPHFHIHLIPRYQDDDAQLGWQTHNISTEEIEKIVKIITK